LNKVIEFDPYPLPAAHRMFNELAMAKYFSKLDLFKAYHQIPVAEASIQYTAFTCEFGHFEYVSMPMGIKTAAAWFQRCVNITFQEATARNTVRGYLDDMIAYTNTLEEHVREVAFIANIIKNASLKLSLKKCVILVKEISFLGKVITQGVVKNCPEKAKCILDMPLPRTYKRLQADMGIFNYQRDYVEMYAAIAEPCYRLLDTKGVPDRWITRKGTVNPNYKLTWSEEQIASFEALKKATGASLERHQANFDIDFHLETDASEKAYGGHIYQIAEATYSLGWHSKTYTKAQLTYATGEKELLAIISCIEHFDYFLYGRHFYIHTDHQPLTFLLTKSNPSKRLQRWMVRLANYNFTIVYKPGKENIIADSLSRMYDDEEIIPLAPSDEDYEDLVIASIGATVEELEEHNTSIIAVVTAREIATTCEKLKGKQEEDKNIQWIAALIKKHGKNRPEETSPENPIQRVLYKHYNTLRIINEVLYQEREDEQGNISHTYVLPEKEINKVMEQLHNSVYGGHLGRRKTKQKAIERFYRPFIANIVDEYIKTCDKCQKIKTLTQITRAEMQIIKPTRTNQIIASDFAGPFIVTENGNKYIQIISDLYSKYAIIIAQPNKEAKNAATALVNRWCCVFGIPDRCLTDGGKEYQSKLWDATCELLDIERSKTTPFHPQCDGQSERLVRTGKTSITAYINETQDNWDQHLPQLSYAYNSSLHGTTNVTPFEAMLGRKPKLPIDLMYPRVETELKEQGASTQDNQIEILEEYQHKLGQPAEEYIESIKKNLAIIGNNIEKSRDKKMDRAKITYDRSIKREKYQIGDKVLVNHPKLAKGQKQGLAYKYYGPFIITGVNTNGCNYTIRKEKKGSRSKQIHKNNIKIYYERGRDKYEEPSYKNQGTNTEPGEKEKITPTPKRNKTRSAKARLKEREDSTGPESTDSESEKVTATKAKRKYTKKTITQAPTHSRSGRLLKKTKE